MATASDLALLLRAIVSDPADDTVRLAYADAVQEAGDENRGEFIRVQCRIAAIQRECGCGACVKLRGGGQHHNGPCAASRRQDDGVYLRRREEELRGEAIAGDWPENIYRWFIHGFPGSLEFAISRGFISSLTASSEDFLRVADSLIWHPEQTVACKAKGCDGGTIGKPRKGDVGGQWMGRMCDACDGTGRISRPFPDTTQPIRHITLSDAEFDDGRFEFYIADDGDVVRSHRWPDVTFTLSSAFRSPIVPPVVREQFRPDDDARDTAEAWQFAERAAATLYTIPEGRLTRVEQNVPPEAAGYNIPCLCRDQSPLYIPPSYTGGEHFHTVNLNRHGSIRTTLNRTYANFCGQCAGCRRVYIAIRRDQPQPMAHSTHGWHIEREWRDVPIDDGSYGYNPREYLHNAVSLTLTVRVPYEPDATRPQPGETLRDLLATDSAGREYRVPTAILERYETQVLRQRYQSPTDTILLTAIASSTPVPL